MTNQHTTVATVSSPSSNSSLTINITSQGRNHPLVGKTVAVESGNEIAIGAITKVTTHNRWHEREGFTGLQGDHPDPDLSGDGADTRDATIHLQACWQRDSPGQPWRQSGPFLHMSPATGVPVDLVDRGIIDGIVTGLDGLHYCGHLGGTNNVPLPLNIPDFSGALGAFHTGIFGRNGSGKTSATAYLLASQMRHPGFGVLVIDPQGQWSSEHGMFSLQGFAEEVGRKVEVKRISEDLQLDANPDLFVTLLRHTKLLDRLGRLSFESKDIICHEMVDILRKYDNWHDAETPSEELLVAILAGLVEEDFTKRLYSNKERRDTFLTLTNRLLEDDDKLDDALGQFRPVHNLFQQHNPRGGQRHPLRHVLNDMFNGSRSAVTTPAPYTVLDMSSAPPPDADTVITDQMRELYAVLERPTIKAAILRHVFAELKQSSEEFFRDGSSLNTLIVLDEAWRFAPPPGKADDPEIDALSTDLAGYSRDTRKFGIGWLYITQSPKSIHPDIFDQMSVRVFGFGLTGSDLSKVREIVADESSLDLYRVFGDPRSTGVWPFLLTGPVSPLVANNTPIVMEVFTDFSDFRRENAGWLRSAHLAAGTTPPESEPARPSGRRLVAAAANRRGLPPAATRKIIDSNEAIQRNRAAVGMTDPDRDPFGLDGDDLPF